LAPARILTGTLVPVFFLFAKLHLRIIICMPQMIIGLGVTESCSLVFDVLNTPVADLWLERMSHRHAWAMDNPDRFYGFNSVEQEQQRALATMQQCIDTVNQYQPIIDRILTRVNDQDTLNYLHNIFELYHGQLDQQTHEFWQTAPEAVRQALAMINITVHRCESLRGGHMNTRFVCTWYGMPKTQTLGLELQQQYGVLQSEFGGVYLNYCEIGKTAMDMANDRDQYMADEMFCPFNYYSADFRVDLYSESMDAAQQRQQQTVKYVQERTEFFQRFGIVDTDDVRIQPLKFKVAQLVYDSADTERIISQIRANQYVNSVTIK
jgi:hypothetical protein